MYFSGWNKKCAYLIALFLSLLILFTICTTNADSNVRIRLGTWITVFSSQKVLYSKENVDRAVETCSKCGITDIYIQIYRADTFYGEDFLEYLINEARKNGIKVHGWINLLSIAQNKDANVLKKFGEEIITKDQHGRSSFRNGKKDELDKYYIRENQIFLEPGDKRVRKHLVGVVKKIVKKYPNLAGVHLDYIRYPIATPSIPGARFASHGISYGFSKTNIKNFKNATGLDLSTMDPLRKNFKLWDDWRRNNVTRLLANISKNVRALNPSLEISCTVVPSIEKAYLGTFQDWSSWLEAGYLDYVIAMNYTDDAKLMKLSSSALLADSRKEKMHIGMGAYLLQGRTDLFKIQLENLKKLSPRGICIFSYDDIAENGEFQKFLNYFSSSKKM